MTICDTYYYLLENHDQRQIGLCSDRIAYQTTQFDWLHYSKSRGVGFETYQEAYLDWLEFGRRLGLEYRKGSNTILKIILKAKDEPVLLEEWINYHVKIVGYHNIIVLDCNSNDESYLKILDRFKSKIMILNYNKYYNYIHSPSENEELYDLLSKNCRYLTILDADEFLTSFNGDRFGYPSILSLLDQSEVDIYAATWLNNIDPVPIANSKVDLRHTISVAASWPALANGTVAGKSIVRSCNIKKITHLGHNLHVADVVKLMSIASFGIFFIIHLRNIDGNTMQTRAEKHLRSKGVLPPEIAGHEEITSFLRDALAKGKSIADDALKYVHSFLDNDAIQPDDKSIGTNLLTGIDVEHNSNLKFEIEKFNFEEILKAHASK